jgi:hypothetical protein
MKHLVLISLFSVLYFTAQSQLSKGAWLVGGTGSFSSTKNSYSNNTTYFSSDQVHVNIAPDLAYFVFDKFALGLKPSFNKSKNHVTSLPSGGNSNENRLNIGPFARYYLLNSDKQFNILTEASYQYGFYWFTPTKGHRNTFSASAGPVVYLNTSVGLEFLIGYYWQNEEINDESKSINKERGLLMTLGFQFYLEK